ncbi:MAG: diguanylate cyclase, partial [Citrobacter sp.]
TYPTDAVIGRRSGDEFHVFLYGIQTQEDVLRRVHNLYGALSESPMVCPDGGYSTIAISVGLIWCDGQMDCDELLLQADRALYEAKKNNKGYFTIGSAH